MNSKVANFTIMLIATSVLNGGCTDQVIDPCEAFAPKRIEYSIEQLLNLSACFNNRHVETTGIIKHMDFGIVIFPNDMDYELNNVYYGLHLNLKGEIQSTLTNDKYPDGSYVVVEGKFMMPQHISINTLPLKIE